MTRHFTYSGFVQLSKYLKKNLVEIIIISLLLLVSLFIMYRNKQENFYSKSKYKLGKKKWLLELKKKKRLLELEKKKWLLNKDDKLIKIKGQRGLNTNSEKVKRLNVKSQQECEQNMKDNNNATGYSYVTNKNNKVSKCVITYEDISGGITNEELFSQNVKNSKLRPIFKQDKKFPHLGNIPYIKKYNDSISKNKSRFVKGYSRKKYNIYTAFKKPEVICNSYVVEEMIKNDKLINNWKFSRCKSGYQMCKTIDGIKNCVNDFCNSSNCREIYGVSCSQKGYNLTCNCNEKISGSKHQEQKDGLCHGGRCTLFSNYILKDNKKLTVYIYGTDLDTKEKMHEAYLFKIHTCDDVFDSIITGKTGRRLGYLTPVIIFGKKPINNNLVIVKTKESYLKKHNELSIIPVLQKVFIPLDNNLKEYKDDFGKLPSEVILKYYNESIKKNNYTNLFNYKTDMKNTDNFNKLTIRDLKYLNTDFGYKLVNDQKPYKFSDYGINIKEINKGDLNYLVLNNSNINPDWVYSKKRSGLLPESRYNIWMSGLKDNHGDDSEKHGLVFMVNKNDFSDNSKVIGCIYINNFLKMAMTTLGNIKKNIENPEIIATARTTFNKAYTPMNLLDAFIGKDTELRVMKKNMRKYKIHNLNACIMRIDNDTYVHEKIGKKCT